MSSKIRASMAEALFIVPAAHTRLADVSFQTEIYELFHRTLGARIGHLIGTPSVLFGTLLLASGAPGAAAPVLVIGLILGVAAFGVAVDRLAGLATAIASVLLAVAALLLTQALGPETALVVALSCVFGGCAVQTFSHVFEDVPPPVSGSPEFVTPSAWRRRVRVFELLRLTLLTFLVFYWLELWACFRILPLQILHLLMWAGHRPDLRRALDARMAAILAAPASDWRRPASRTARPGGDALPVITDRDRGGAP